MNWILNAIAFLFSLNAFALGPIPNGTYTGTETCAGSSYPTRMIYADKTLRWDNEIYAFDFDSNSNGFFNVKTTSGMTGSGLGHFTDSGLHYEIIFDYVGEDGSTHPAPGEVTLTYTQGVIHLESSASAGSDGKITCIGDFFNQPLEE